MLTKLGATPAEDRVYRFLVTAVSAPECEIADATGLSEDDVRAALESLVGRRLVERMPDSPSRFVAASPGVVESMISERLAELRTAQQTLDGLASHYRANSLAREAGGVFEIMRGQDALRQCSISLLSSARSEVLNLIKPPLIAVKPNEQIGPAKSVRNRIVYETAALEPAILEALRAGLCDGDEAKVHTKLPIKMLVADQSVALLPLVQHDTTPIGVLVRESALLDALLTLFEYVWATAIPLHVGNGRSNGSSNGALFSDDDREVLSLLLAGLSDEAIAMHRKTSVRTVQRKVRSLMTTANVRTRMQLAWEAARHDWV
jgi:sugar-specific transcriptional regulator TrmB/DNA-binding CsgD family transcriptional regulator